MCLKLAVVMLDCWVCRACLQTQGCLYGLAMVTTLYSTYVVSARMMWICSVCEDDVNICSICRRVA
jgi:hypothetical protein